MVQVTQGLVSGPCLIVSRLNFRLGTVTHGPEREFVGPFLCFLYFMMGVGAHKKYQQVTTNFILWTIRRGPETKLSFQDNELWS